MNKPHNQPQHLIRLPNIVTEASANLAQEKRWRNGSSRPTRLSLNNTSVLLAATSWADGATDRQPQGHEGVSEQHGRQTTTGLQHIRGGPSGNLEEFQQPDPNRLPFVRSNLSSQPQKAIEGRCVLPLDHL